MLINSVYPHHSLAVSLQEWCHSVLEIEYGWHTSSRVAIDDMFIECGIKSCLQQTYQHIWQICFHMLHIW